MIRSIVACTSNNGLKMRDVCINWKHTLDTERKVTRPVMQQSKTMSHEQLQRHYSVCLSCLVSIRSQKEKRLVVCSYYPDKHTWLTNPTVQLGYELVKLYLRDYLRWDQ